MWGRTNPHVFAWGNIISTDIQSTTPAGWYTDPAGGGGQRWWDGVQWTSHLQAVAPVQPPLPPQQAVVPAAPTPMTMQDTPRVDPYGQATNPYGLPAVERPYVPMQGMNNARIQQQQPYGNQNYASAPRQTAGLGYAIAGILFFALSLVGLVPGSPIYFFSYGSIIAVIGGARLLYRRGKGLPIKLWPILVALILGGLSILISGSELALNTYAASHVTSTNSVNSSGQGSTGGSGSQVATSSGVVPTPPTFASDPSLTAYEQTAANVAKAVDQYANGGMASSPAGGWPDALTLDNNGEIILPSGTAGAYLPVDQLFKYEASKDHTNFAVFISGGNKTEIAIYDSETNSFKWICEDGAPSTCPAGGLPADSDSGATTSNS